MKSGLLKKLNLLPVIFIFSSFIFAQPNLDKIEPTIFDSLSINEKVKVIVRFDIHPDLSYARQIENWDERGWYVYNILTENAQATQEYAVQILNDGKRNRDVDFYKSHWINNSIVTSCNEGIILELAELEEIESIRLPLLIPLPTPTEEVNIDRDIEWGIQKIHADQVWNEYGITGEGVVVGFIDSGVLYTHEALVGSYRGNNQNGTFNHNYNWFDAIAYSINTPEDVHGHGTHTLGTAVGYTDENQIGVAPGAKWITARACYTGGCYGDDLISSLEFMLAPTNVNGNNPNPSLRPHVVNNSWGTCDFTEYFRQEVDNLRSAGIFPVFSAGNTTNCQYEEAFCSSVGTPASYKESFAVGATKENDDIADISLWGPSPDPSLSYLIKPDVVAPGHLIRSSFNNGGYTTYSGTSMAAPHVTGSVALLLSKYPSLIGEVEIIETRLKQSATGFSYDPNCNDSWDNIIPNNVFGYGLTNAMELLDPSENFIPGIIDYYNPELSVWQINEQRTFFNLPEGYNDGVYDVNSWKYEIVIPHGDPNDPNWIVGYGPNDIKAWSGANANDCSPYFNIEQNGNQFTLLTFYYYFINDAVTGSSINEWLPFQPSIFPLLYSNGIIGDVNIDDLLNLIDVVITTDHILGLIPFTFYQNWAGDLNRDAEINIIDILEMIDIILGEPMQMEFAPSKINNEGPIITFKESSVKGNERAKSTSSQFFEVILSTEIPLRGLHLELLFDTTLYEINDIFLTELDSIFDIADSIRSDTIAFIDYSVEGNIIEPGEISVATIEFSQNSGRYFDINPFSINTGVVLTHSGELIKVNDNKEGLIPDNYSLLPAYPNPFNPTTTLKYALPERAQIKLQIFDITGRLVKTISNHEKTGGTHQTQWQGTNQQGEPVSSGMYFVRLSAASTNGKKSFIQSQKIVLLK